MKPLHVATAALFAGLLSSAAIATEYDPEDDDRAHQDLVTYRFFMAAPDAPEVQAPIRRDLQYADEMMEHHRGAVRMSRAYLDDERGSNPFLQRMATAIIANQRFEIEWLEDLRRRVAKGPQPVIDVGDFELVRVEQGISGMEHRVRFLKTPIWAPSDFVNLGGDHISEFDVMFAKAMKMHHEMALEMALAYDSDPNGENVVIRELNFDILRDQDTEIFMLERFIANYSGDPDAVAIPAEMHEMMGMPHHM